MRRRAAVLIAVVVAASSAGFAVGAVTDVTAATPPTDRSTLDAVCAALNNDAYTCTPTPTTTTTSAPAPSTTTTTVAPTTTTVAPVTLNNLARDLYSMDGADEGPLHGVPSYYSWCCTPTVGNVAPPSGFTSMTGWGQVYADANVTEPAGTRVELKNMATYVHSRTRGWLRTQATVQVDGAHFVEDFSGNASVNADWRTEPDGGISSALISGYNLHFWPTGARPTLPASDIDAEYTTVQARLLGGGQYLANVGGDWWLNPTVGYGTGGNNPGIGQGRFMYLSSTWQAFDFWTGGKYATVPPGWSDTQLSAAVPPVDPLGHP